MEKVEQIYDPSIGGLGQGIGDHHYTMTFDTFNGNDEGHDNSVSTVYDLS